jgi:hypothetical protein
VINKDLTRDAAVEVTGFTPKQAQAIRLTAPSLDAMNGVTLGGAAVNGDGSWKNAKADAVKIAGGKAVLDVSAGSAALITLT